MATGNYVSVRFVRVADPQRSSRQRNGIRRATGADARSAWRVAISGRLGVLVADPKKRSVLKPEAIWEVDSAASLTATDVLAASLVSSEWFACAAALFGRFDALVLPSAQVFPFYADWSWPREVAGRRMTTYHQWMEVVTPATLAGLPALSIVWGFLPTASPWECKLSADAATMPEYCGSPRHTTK